MFFFLSLTRLNYRMFSEQESLPSKILITPGSQRISTVRFDRRDAYLGYMTRETEYKTTLGTGLESRGAFHLYGKPGFLVANQNGTA